MSIRNLQIINSGLDELDNDARRLFADSLREAGTALIDELWQKSPYVRSPVGKNFSQADRLSDSFGVWYSKKLSRRYRAATFRIGLATNFFYSGLSTGFKDGRRASHPEWQLPGEDPVLAEQITALAKRIFEAKLNAMATRRK